MMPALFTRFSAMTQFFVPMPQCVARRWSARSPSSWASRSHSGMCNNTMLDGSVNPRDQDLAEAERNKLSPYRAFYLATLGGARSLYLDDVLGNFDKGKEADFVALDW